MDVCLCVVFEQRACWIVNFNVSQSMVANHEVRLSRLSAYSGALLLNSERY